MLKLHTKEDVFEYLDELRESGDINMLGARPYLLKQFPLLTLDKSADLLTEWMKSKHHETK